MIRKIEAKHTRQRPSAQWVVGVIAVASGLAGCGTVVGNPKKPGGTPPNTAVVTTPVNDADAQKQAVTSQLDQFVAALSDGGSLATGDGVGAGIGLADPSAKLADRAAFSETRHCKVAASGTSMSLTSNEGVTWPIGASNPAITLTRSLAGTRGHLTYKGHADGSDSGFTETWYPGPFFGLQNVPASSAAVHWGNVTAPASGHSLTGIPSGKPAVTPPAGSSGALGSVGWRSQDGSWTGAPVWEVGASYAGSTTAGALAADSTIGMVMYLSSNMPSFTCAAASSEGGVCVAGGVSMSPVSGRATRFADVSVLGYGRANVLPSFQSGGQILANGQATPLKQAGTVDAPGVPARMYNPPDALDCDSLGLAASPGWKFSQNVAGLTRRSTTHISSQRSMAKGDITSTVDGTQETVWYDPATMTPAPASGAFFDENAGVITMARRINLGSKATPNQSSATYQPTHKDAFASLTSTTYTSKPIEDVVTRSLLSKGWDWTKRTVSSGSIVTTQAVNGADPVASVETTFQDVVFTAGADVDRACVPSSGTITSVITPVDTTQQTSTITLKFGTTAAVAAADGVTATVTCSGGVAGAANCTSQAEADDADYQPSGCDF